MGVIILALAYVAWRGIRKRAAAKLTANPPATNPACDAILTSTPSPSTMERAQLPCFESPATRDPGFQARARLWRIQQPAVRRAPELLDSSTAEYLPAYSLSYKEPILTKPPPCYTPWRMASAHPPPYETPSRWKSALKLW
ncbi:hypothetical protein CALVIDRAFT_135531 [Calocera viscosa TUFC12733]|uniref:Uncharacterized protein n=1 Tax=Calocera viscosa (strain TUFC12733) TaxID=1330018 RepID=A0A167LXV4_CALVF|nr:hypothetical protein CALVIDRAFT_135531 [Calocera viscosa TUFC12733]